MVVPALVLVERLAVVCIEYDDCAVEDLSFFQVREDRLDARVHVRDGAIVLGDDVILVGDAWRHPVREEVPERLE